MKKNKNRRSRHKKSHLFTDLDSSNGGGDTVDTDYTINRTIKESNLINIYRAASPNPGPFRPSLP